MNQIDNRLRFHCEQSLYADGFKLHIATGRPVNAYAKPIEFEAVPEGTPVERPAMVLDRDAGQELIDTLWAAGLRPTQGRQSEGVTAAQGRHLEDMRALAFGKLNIAQP